MVKKLSPTPNLTIKRKFLFDPIDSSLVGDKTYDIRFSKITVDWHSGSWIRKYNPFPIIAYTQMYTHMSVLSNPSLIIDRGMAV